MKHIFSLLILLCFLPTDAWSFGARAPSTGQTWTASDRSASSFSGTTTSCMGQPIPSSVQAAVRDVLNFAKSCSHLSGWERMGNKIAINDYSSTANPPTMYIFDPSGKNCLMKVPIAYGGGGEGIRPPAPCSGDGQKLTPPGIHITSNHNGKRYSGANAIGMVGLSGQGSVGRGVIMHPKNAVGAPSTWGCTGIEPSEFSKVKQLLGEGSLVYNSFGSTSPSRNCNDASGIQRPPSGSSCRVDPGGTSPSTLMRRGSYGSSSPSGPRSRGVQPQGTTR